MTQLFANHFRERFDVGLVGLGHQNGIARILVYYAADLLQYIVYLRQVIGATDPAEAKPGTIRKLYGESKERNAIHASDTPDTAARELAFFFTEAELRELA